MASAITAALLAEVFSIAVGNRYDDAGKAGEDAQKIFDLVTAFSAEDAGWTTDQLYDSVGKIVQNIQKEMGVAP